MIHRFGERSCRRGLPIGGDHPRLRTEGEPASIAAEGDGRAGAVADEHALAAAVEVEKVKGAAANLGGEPELGVHRAVRQRAPVCWCATTLARRRPGARRAGTPPATSREGCG
jgi:hypothetical protein